MTWGLRAALREEIVVSSHVRYHEPTNSFVSLQSPGLMDPACWDDVKAAIHDHQNEGQQRLSRAERAEKRELSKHEGIKAGEILAQSDEAEKGF